MNTKKTDFDLLLERLDAYLKQAQKSTTSLGGDIGLLFKNLGKTPRALFGSFKSGAQYYTEQDRQKASQNLEKSDDQLRDVLFTGNQNIKKNRGY